MSSKEYLRHLFHEELFLINEPEKNLQADNPDTSEPSTIAKTSPSKSPTPLLILAEIANEREKDLLSKVLSAVGYSLEQVTITSKDQSSVYAPDKTISFEDHLTGFNYYEITSSEEGDRLYSKSLTTLMSSVEDKKALWSSLKMWFEIS
jgi:DNA polymerase III psi subunit